METKFQRTGERPFRNRGRGSYRGGGGRGGYSGNAPERKFDRSQDDRSLDSPIVSMFRKFAESLDAKNDLYEVLVKNSRDTTIESKRIIFLLIRCAGRDPNSLEVSQFLNEASERLHQLENSAVSLIAKSLIGQDPVVFNRAFTPGVQEYIEALSLFHFIKHGSLISLDAVRSRFVFSQENQTYSLPVTTTDFLLGIGDLTGELMRFSVTHASHSATQASVFLLCDFARAILMEYQRIPWGVGKDFALKLKVMQQSVFKIERVCYALALRQSENLPLPPGFMLNVDDFEEDMHDTKEYL